MCIYIYRYIYIYPIYIFNYVFIYNDRVIGIDICLYILGSESRASCGFG